MSTKRANGAAGKLSAKSLFVTFHSAPRTETLGQEKQRRERRQRRARQRRRGRAKRRLFIWQSRRRDHLGNVAANRCVGPSFPRRVPITPRIDPGGRPAGRRAFHQSRRVANSRPAARHTYFNFKRGTPPPPPPLALKAPTFARGRRPTRGTRPLPRDSPRCRSLRRVNLATRGATKKKKNHKGECRECRCRLGQSWRSVPQDAPTPRGALFKRAKSA